MWKQWTCTCWLQEKLEINFFFIRQFSACNSCTCFSVFLSQSTNNKVKQNLDVKVFNGWLDTCIALITIYYIHKGFKKVVFHFLKVYHHSCKSIYFVFVMFLQYICRSFCKFFMFCVLFVNKLSFYIYEYCFCLEIGF